MIPEEAKVNLGMAELNRHRAIWLQWGVLKVVVKGGGAQVRHLGVQTEGVNHLHSLTAGHDILFWELKFEGFHVHVNYNQSKVLIYRLYNLSELLVIVLKRYLGIELLG